MLPILYQDQDLVVINKPSGLLVHRTKVDIHETVFALQLVRDQIGAHVYPVHRLDKPTSGALVFALSSHVAQAMAERFAGGKVHKRYLAIVRGTVLEKVTIDYPLKEKLDRATDRLAKADKSAQIAVTEVRALATYEFPIAVDRYPTTRYSLVEAMPRTGRKHQVRRHLRHLGHPVIGDVTYGVGKHNRFFAGRYANRRLLLACTEIGFTHPTTGQPLLIKAPLAQEFAEICADLGWTEHVH